MTFQVIIDPKVPKKAKKYLSKAHQKKLFEFVETLQYDPFPRNKFDLRKIKSFENLYALRLGKYRVLYVILWDKRVVIIEDILPRESAYKR